MPKTVIVEISYSGKNFGAYVPILPGCVATGATPQEIRKNIEEAIAFHVESSLADGDPMPNIFKIEYTLTYKFDVESLLNYYKKIFTKPALESITGINQKQLHHYADGLKKPRQVQAKKIETALHNLGYELLSVAL